MRVPGDLSAELEAEGEGQAQGFTAVLITHVFCTVKNLDGVTENWVKEKVRRR